MRFLLAIVFLACGPAYGADGQWELLVPTQADAHEDSLLMRAEALDAAAVDVIVEEAYASIGCALPSDLVSVFEVYLVDRAMMALGEPVGADVAQQGFVALRLNAGTVRHPEAGAVLAAAQAVDGEVAADIRSGRMTMRLGLFRVADCEPAGTLFALSPYAQQ